MPVIGHTHLKRGRLDAGRCAGFLTRYILGYTLQRHTIRELPSFDPEKGILINPSLKQMKNSMAS